MRIISGIAHGTKLRVPDHVARPTTDRIREALFSILGELVQEARVLDLFAGSGSLGLEALSRGAASAVFVDTSAKSCAVIRKNLIAAGLPEKGRVRHASMARTLNDLQRGDQRFDLVFADPPYFRGEGDDDLVKELLSHPALAELIEPEGFLCLEHSGHSDLETELFEVRTKRRYGRGQIEILQKLS